MIDDALTDNDLYQLVDVLDLEKHFVDIPYKDRLPRTKVNGKYIINLQDKYNSAGYRNLGSHWIAMIVHCDIGFYFDSFGLHPPNSIQSYLNKHTRIWYWSKRQIQDIQATTCGYYCLAFLRYMDEAHQKGTSMKQSFQEFVNMFDDDTMRNNSILLKYLRAEFYEEFDEEKM